MQRNMIDPSNVTHITEEQFLEALSKDLKRFDHWLACVFGDSEAICSLALDSRDTKKEILSLPIGYKAWRAFHYAENGAWLHGRQLPDIDELLCTVCTLADLIRSFDDSISPEMDQVQRKLIARAKVDRYRFVDIDDDVLNSFISWWLGDNPRISIDDVAFVCSMTSSSVRNHTTAKAQDRLLTYKEDGRTWVDVNSLLDWLPRRRGYIETQLTYVKPAEVSDFVDRDGMEHYIRTVINNRELNSDLVSDATGIPGAELALFCVGGPTKIDFNLKQLVLFAKLADITDTDFIERANRVLLAELLLSEGVTKKAGVVTFPGGKKS